jgi:ELWxxDGT repeat protein
VGDKLFFVANETVGGDELWVSDGSTAGTTLLMANTGPSGSGVFNYMNLMAFDGDLYFTAYTIATNYQLWKSDGTTAGTVRVTMLNTTGSGTDIPTNFLNSGTTLFFTAPGATLWAYTPP